MRYQTPAISQSKNSPARSQANFLWCFMNHESISKQRERKLNSKLGPNTYTRSQTPKQILLCHRPPCSNLLPGCQSSKENPATPWVQLSFHPTSSRFYRYQMVQLSLCKHWKENPAEAILKIGRTDFLELFRSLSWRENKTKEVSLNVLASLSGVTRNHCAF